MDILIIVKTVKEKTQESIEMKTLKHIENMILKERIFHTEDCSLGLSQTNMQKIFQIEKKRILPSLMLSGMEGLLSIHALYAEVRKAMGITLTIPALLMLFGYAPFITKKLTRFQK